MVVVIYLRAKFSQLSEVTATKLSWHKKPGNVPELHFCKAEELTPKRFCKDTKGDLALSLSQPELSESLGTGAASNRWEKKRQGNKFFSAVFIGQRRQGLKQI